MYTLPFLFEVYYDVFNNGMIWIYFYFLLNNKNCRKIPIAQTCNNLTISNDNGIIILKFKSHIFHLWTLSVCLNMPEHAQTSGVDMIIEYFEGGINKYGNKT